MPGNESTGSTSRVFCKPRKTGSVRNSVPKPRSLSLIVGLAWIFFPRRIADFCFFLPPRSNTRRTLPGCEISQRYSGVSSGNTPFVRVYSVWVGERFSMLAELRRDRSFPQNEYSCRESRRCYTAPRPTANPVWVIMLRGDGARFVGMTTGGPASFWGDAQISRIHKLDVFRGFLQPFGKRSFWHCCSILKERIVVAERGPFLLRQDTPARWAKCQPQRKLKSFPRGSRCNRYALLSKDASSVHRSRCGRTRIPRICGRPLAGIARVSGSQLPVPLQPIY